MVLVGMCYQQPGKLVTAGGNEIRHGGNDAGFCTVAI
jgi:hypothetical protein